MSAFPFHCGGGQQTVILSLELGSSRLIPGQLINPKYSDLLHCPGQDLAASTIGLAWFLLFDPIGLSAQAGGKTGLNSLAAYTTTALTNHINGSLFVDFVCWY